MKRKTSILVYFHCLEARSLVSPLSIAAALCGFSFVANVNLLKWIESVVCFVSSPMFGVNLLHECCLKSWQYSYFAAHSWLYAFAWTVLLFFGCIIIDFAIRGIFCLLNMAVEYARRRLWAGDCQF